MPYVSQCTLENQLTYSPLFISLCAVFRLNVFTFGADTNISISGMLTQALEDGAVAQMWFSKLSLGEVTRIAANSYMSNVDVCEEMSKVPLADDGLPRSCPVAAGRRLPFQTQIGKALWEGVEDYRSTVVGASGELELRLLSGPACDGWFDTDCEEPETLLGLTLPFKIVDGDGNGEDEGDGDDDLAQQDNELATTAQSSSAPAVSCEDTKPDCAGWAKSGECQSNPGFMLQGCKKSCGGCGGDGPKQDPAECADNNAAECPRWAQDGQCKVNPAYMLQECKESCGACGDPRDEL